MVHRLNVFDLGFIVGYFSNFWKGSMFQYFYKYYNFSLKFCTSSSTPRLDYHFSPLFKNS